MSDSERSYMQRALQLAERGWGQTAPNPMVGAVLVRDGATVGEGWHPRFGAPHAEVNAIASAGANARGSHLYVTLEPCAHHGKTPPCTDAILAAGISRVSIATLDPTSAGGGAAVLRRAGVQVDVGCGEGDARELNAAFFFATVADRPWITVKLATSAEGAIAAAPGSTGVRQQTWLTGDEARAEVHRLRAGVDAVAVGIGTVLADDPQLTVRHFPEPRVAPRRVVFDRGARTPPGAKLVRTAREVPTMIIVRERNARSEALAAAGVEILIAADAADALRALRRRDIYSMLVEGGAGLTGALLNIDCVDRMILLRSPVRLGPGALEAFACVDDRASFLAALQLRTRRHLGADVMHVYAVAGHDV